MRKLYIIGAGGFGREVAWLVERINQVTATWDLLGFIDDNPSLWGRKCGGYTVLGGIKYLNNVDCESWVVCAVGSARARKKIVEEIKDINFVKFATLVDPSVLYSSSVKIGEGSIVCAGTIMTVDISVGKHVIINLDCTLGHDDIIEDYVTLYPSINVSGNVRIGKETELGTGSQIIQGINIANHVILGAGSVVCKSIVEEGTYVGVPVRKIK